MLRLWVLVENGCRHSFLVAVVQLFSLRLFGESQKWKIKIELNQKLRKKKLEMKLGAITVPVSCDKLALQNQPMACNYSH